MIGLFVFVRGLGRGERESIGELASATIRIELVLEKKLFQICLSHHSGSARDTIARLVRLLDLH